MQRSINLSSTQSITINQNQASKPIKELTLQFPVSSGTRHRTKAQTDTQPSEVNIMATITENNAQYPNSQLAIQDANSQSNQANSIVKKEPESIVI